MLALGASEVRTKSQILGSYSPAPRRIQSRANHLRRSLVHTWPAFVAFLWLTKRSTDALLDVGIGLEVIAALGAEESGGRTIDCGKWYMLDLVRVGCHMLSLSLLISPNIDSGRTLCQCN